MFKVVTFEYLALIFLCRHLREKIIHQTLFKKKRALSLPQQHQELTMAGMGQ